MTRRAALLALAVLAAAAPTAPAATSPMTLVYDLTDVVERLVDPPSGRGLTPERGALRQDPGSGGMLAPGDNAPYRVGKVSGRDLEGMTAAQMAEALRLEIEEGSYGAGSHLVAIDEIGRRFGDGAPRVPRRGMRLPPVDPSSPGARFAAAMRLLDVPSPYGGTWASRVHVYLAPAVHTAIAAGRGPERNLGRDGKPHWSTWRGVMPGLARAGGVHLQMYSGVNGRAVSFTAATWRSVPPAFLGLFGRYGGDASRVHFLFTGGTVPKGSPRGCGDAMGCTWALAEATPAGRAILANGPGVYRIGGDALAWLREFNRRFD